MVRGVGILQMATNRTLRTERNLAANTASRWAVCRIDKKRMNHAPEVPPVVYIQI
jgi:hypothetical protein